MDSNYNPFSLAGKTILVTGASSGIGRATAIECSRLGAKVVLSARNAGRLNETFSALSGDGHQILPADLTNQEQLGDLVAKSPEVNGIVLSAGRSVLTPFLFCSRDKFDEIMDINFYSQVETLRLFAKKKKLVKGGSAVVVASIGGTHGGKFTSGNDVYGTSKAALCSIMRYAAKELASKNIRVNTINPGMVDTKLIHGGAVTEEQHAIDMAKYPLKRYGKPEEIAYGIIYLLSDAAAWVTGHSLVIDGGVTI